MISFDSIPANLRTPGTYVEFDASRAARGLPAAPTRTLLIGQRFASGRVPALQPTEIASADAAIEMFGRGSMLEQMARAFRRADPYSECWAVALDDNPAGTAAVYTMTISTAQTVATGTFAVTIGGRTVEIGIAKGAPAVAIAALLAVRITENPDVPVTADVAGATITLTARHKGASGNGIDLRETKGVAGLAVAFALVTIGVGDPDITPVFAAIGDLRVSGFVLGFADATALAAMAAELTSRWSPPRMQDGLAFAAKRGSQGGLAALGATLNSPYLSIMGLREVPNPEWEWAATYGAVVGFNAGVDPARPFQTLALSGLSAPMTAGDFTRLERELLLHDGISTFVVDAGGVVRISRAITTYRINSTGFLDIAYLDVNTPLTLAYLRLAVRSRIALKYPRHKLASDDVIVGAGSATVTPKILRAELIALFRELEEAGLVEGLDRFVADLIVERDKDDPNRVNALIPPDIVNQFRVFAAKVEFRL